MESFKANFIIFLFIAIISLLGYWAFDGIRKSTDSLAIENTLEDVGPIVSTQPEEENSENLEESPDQEESSSVVSEDNNTQPEEIEEENNSSDEDLPLIKDLQELIDDKVLMKKGSKGTRVGTVQKFLIRYGISMKVDNDYGDTTVNAIKKFQTEQKLGADGQAGEGTYKKMIEWLQNN